MRLTAQHSTKKEGEREKKINGEKKKLCVRVCVRLEMREDT